MYFKSSYVFLYFKCHAFSENPTLIIMFVKSVKI